MFCEKVEAMTTAPYTDSPPISHASADCPSRYTNKSLPDSSFMQDGEHEGHAR